MKRCLLITSDVADAAGLHKEVGPGGIVCPLTTEGVVASQDHSSHVCSLNQIIPHRRVVELGWQAQELMERFADVACQGVKLDGIDWPKAFLGEPELFYFWDLLLAQDLSQVLLVRGFDQVIWIGANDYPVHVPLYAFRATLRTALGSRLSTYSPRAISGELKQFHKRIRSRLSRVRKPRFACPSEIEPCDIITIFATEEWKKFTGPLRELHDTYGDALQLWYLGFIPDRLQAWADTIGLRVVSIPYPHKVDEDVHRFFAGHWAHWEERGRYDLARFSNCQALKSDALLPYFRQFFNYTLPRTVQWARTLRDFMQQAGPAWLLGSSSYAYMTVFPYYVAKALGVPSIALSHSYVPGDNGIVASTYLACRNGFERKNFQRAFPADKQVIYCRNPSNSLTYDANPGFSLSTERRPIVAILASSPRIDQAVITLVDTTEFLATLRNLSNPPEDLGDLHFVFKSHPRIDMSSLVQPCVSYPNVEVVPASTSVTELLKTAWITVICNHYGGEVVEAVITGKPLIFLNPAKFFYPYVETIGFAAGEVVEDMAAFWQLIRHLKHSSGFYADLANRCRRFRSEYLQPAQYTIAQQLTVLEGKSV